MPTYFEYQLFAFVCDGLCSDTSDYEALVEEYARQPLVRVPRVQELQGSTEEQMPMDVKSNNF